ncbi:hypothetical protein AB0K51_01700 [Kitasatospora sp. NPDC049285]|uniref:hypothetical protein n=1 Tax=Kitasatospora sp. NPDC049285 TaxID=3157096 RepID=UPI0034431FE9
MDLLRREGPPTSWDAAPADPEQAVAVDALQRAALDGYFERAGRWVAHRAEDSPEWREAAGTGDTLLHPTATELTELTSRIDELTRPYLAAAGRLPYLLLSLHAGGRADRYGHRRRMVIATDPGRAALLLTVPLAFVSGVGVMVLDITAGAIFAACVPDALRSRVSGAYQAVNYGVRPLVRCSAGRSAPPSGCARRRGSPRSGRRPPARGWWPRRFRCCDAFLTERQPPGHPSALGHMPDGYAGKSRSPVSPPVALRPGQTTAGEGGGSDAPCSARWGGTAVQCPGSRSALRKPWGSPAPWG